MTNQSNFAELDKPTLSSSLNVLTILTFIGSGISIIFSLASPAILKFSKGFMDKAATSGQELSSKQIEDMDKGRQAIELAQANIVPSIIVGVLGAVLCIVAAVMMRKLKKDGYWIYIAGELLPLITAFILMGTRQFTGITSIIFAVGIPVLFIVLYTLQKKNLVN